MKLLFSLSFLMLFSDAQASCGKPLTLPELRSLVQEVRDAHFPALSDHELPFQNYESDSYFFQATVNPGELLRGRKKFCLDVNSELLNCPPSSEALKAIISHELSHFQDYQSLPILGVAKLGIAYGVSKKYRRSYERQTDRNTVLLGHGPGLIDYRLWLYERLSPKAVRTKKYYYLSPEEIALISF